MAKSAAKKRRDKMVRQGKLNPEIMRGGWNGVNPVQKVLPNKKKDFKEKVAGF